MCSIQAEEATVEQVELDLDLNDQRALSCVD